MENYIRDFKELGYELSVDGLEAVLTRKTKVNTFKKVFAYRFPSEARMLEFIKSSYEGTLNIIKDKEIRKVQTKDRNIIESKEVLVGDIFHYSWGWEQTNCEFFQVTAKPSLSTVIVRRISKQEVETCSWASANVRPVRDAFIGAEEKVRLNGKSFRRSFGYASKIENPSSCKFYSSWYA